MQHSFSKPVKITYCINKIKNKTNGGRSGNVYIEQKALDHAKLAYDQYISENKTETAQTIIGLALIWKKLNNAKDEQKPYLRSMFDKYINRAYDNSALFSDKLISHFIKSLQSFMASANISNASHQTIIQAHLDMVSIAHRQEIQNFNDPKATELIRILDIAMEEHI